MVTVGIYNLYWTTYGGGEQVSAAIAEHLIRSGHRVVLFGPETPVMYAPLGREVRSLYRPTPCSPCINVHDNKVASCIYGRPECLVNITVDDIEFSGDNDANNNQSLNPDKPNRNFADTATVSPTVAKSGMTARP